MGVQSYCASRFRAILSDAESVTVATNKVVGRRAMVTSVKFTKKTIQKDTRTTPGNGMQGARDGHEEMREKGRGSAMHIAFCVHSLL